MKMLDVICLKGCVEETFRKEIDLWLLVRDKVVYKYKETVKLWNFKARTLKLFY